MLVEQPPLKRLVGGSIPLAPTKEEIMKGRAQTVEQKREILRRLLAAWTSERGQHQRLAQLIVNAAAADPYYFEDFLLIEKIESHVAGSDAT